jgi:hypothetical protein
VLSVDITKDHGVSAGPPRTTRFNPSAELTPPLMG